MGSPDWERLRQRLTEHRQAGRVARAEELLRSWGGTLPYQPWVWAELGDILLERGDLPGAGRALFWAGVRSEAATPAIAEYLRRHGRHPRQLLSSVPRRVRAGWEHFPPKVRQDLAALGIREEHLAARGDRAPSRPGGHLLASAVVLAIVAVFAVGMWHSGRMLWGWLVRLFG